MEQEQVKKILIHFPDDANKVLAYLPFIYLMHERYPDAEKYILISKKHVEYFLMLPFRVRCYSIEEENYTNPLKIHHFCYNLVEVFNIDLSFSFDENWKSSFVAFCFRSKIRLGYNVGASKFFLQKHQNYNEGEHPADQAVRLYNHYIGQELIVPQVTTAKLKPYLNDYEIKQYVLIALTGEEYNNQEYIGSLVELFEITNAVSYLFVCADEMDEEFNFEEFKKDFPKSNKYQDVTSVQSLNEKLHLMTSTHGVITSYTPFMFACAYMNISFAKIGRNRHMPKDIQARHVFLEKNGTGFDNSALLDEFHEIFDIVK